MKHPPCEVCGGPVNRRTEHDDKPERKDKWLQRRTCSIICQRTLGTLSRGNTPRSEIIAAPCEICGKPAAIGTRKKPNRTCGERDCLAAIRSKAITASWRNGRPPKEQDFPQVTGEMVADFSAHNVALKPSRQFTMAMPDPTRTLGGCASSWLAGASVE